MHLLIFALRCDRHPVVVVALNTVSWMASVVGQTGALTPSCRPHSPVEKAPLKGRIWSCLRLMDLLGTSSLDRLAACSPVTAVREGVGPIDPCVADGVGRLGSDVIR